MASMMVLGFGFFLLHNSVQTEVTELAPSARASSFSLHAFSFFMGQALGPWVYGIALPTVEATISLTAGAVILAATGLLANRLLRPLGASSTCLVRLEGAREWVSLPRASRTGSERMTNTSANQQALLARFAEALNARHDHATVTHSELSAAWPGNPAGKSSLKQLLEVISPDWNADYRAGNGDYVFSQNVRLD